MSLPMPLHLYWQLWHWPLVGPMAGDPLMEIVGAIVIARWSWGLIRDTRAILLSTVPDQALATDVREILETNGDKVSDLHLWRVGPGHLAVIVSLVSDSPQEPSHFKVKLATLLQLSHVTIEVQPCRQALKAA